MLNMRDWTRHDSYLNQLLGDVYAQPESNDLHGPLAFKAINFWMARLTGCNTVLDLGCGEGFCQPFFEQWDVKYEGVCLGDDYLAAKEKGRNVKKMDFSFLEYEDKSFDLLFSRHSLEHSPMPLLSLMEWRRVSKQWLGLILPAPEWYGFVGQNHYHVLYLEQWENLLDNAGWKPIWTDVDSLLKDEKDPNSITAHEYWLFAEKK